jgi:hypothetical protein
VISLKLSKLEVSQTKNIYRKPNIKNKAPNWVQKNINKAASTHLLVFAKLCSIKNEGTNKSSYDKKNNISESVKKSR